MIRVAFALFAAALFACGPKPAPTTPQPIGGVCTSDAGCTSGLVCDTRIPHGICTKDCTLCPAGCDGDCKPGCALPSAMPCMPGCNTQGAFGCPDDGRCVEVVATGIDAFRCVAQCGPGGACRTDGKWTCQSPKGYDFSVCVP